MTTLLYVHIFDFVFFSSQICWVSMCFSSFCSAEIDSKYITVRHPKTGKRERKNRKTYTRKNKLSAREQQQQQRQQTNGIRTKQRDRKKGLYSPSQRFRCTTILALFRTSWQMWKRSVWSSACFFLLLLFVCAVASELIIANNLLLISQSGKLYAKLRLARKKRDASTHKLPIRCLSSFFLYALPFPILRRSER